MQLLGHLNKLQCSSATSTEVIASSLVATFLATILQCMQLLSLFSVQCALHVPYLGHSGHSTNKQDFSNFILVYLGIFETLMAGLHCPLNKTANQRLKLGSSQLQVHVFGATGIHSDVRKVDVRLYVARQGHLVTAQYAKKIFNLFES